MGLTVGLSQDLRFASAACKKGAGALSLVRAGVEQVRMLARRLRPLARPGHAPAFELQVRLQGPRLHLDLLMPDEGHVQ